MSSCGSRPNVLTDAMEPLALEVSGSMYTNIGRIQIATSITYIFIQGDMFWDALPLSTLDDDDDSFNSSPLGTPVGNTKK